VGIGVYFQWVGQSSERVEAMAYTRPSLEMFQTGRNFSTAGIVVSRLRSWLSPAHVDMIVFLRKNYRDIDSYALIKEGVDE
jgi:hypothetical protein